MPLGLGRPGASAGPLGAGLKERSGSHRTVEKGRNGAYGLFQRTGEAPEAEAIRLGSENAASPDQLLGGMAVDSPLANDGGRTVFLRRTYAIRLCGVHAVARHSIQPRTSPPDCERSRSKPQDPLPAGIPGPLPPLRDPPPCGPRLTTRLRGLESAILTSGP